VHPALQISKETLARGAYEDFAAQWLMRENYEYVFYHPGVFVVQRTKTALAKAFADAPVRIGPTHFDARMVIVKRSRDGLYLFLFCTCGFYSRTLLCCCHIWCVKNGIINLAHDLHPRYFIAYGTTAHPAVKRYIDDGTADGPRLGGVETGLFATIQSAFQAGNGTFTTPHSMPEPDLPRVTKPGLQPTTKIEEAKVVPKSKTAPLTSARYGDFVTRGTKLIQHAAQVDIY